MELTFFAFLITGILLIVLFNRTSRLEKDNKGLRQRIQDLEEGEWRKQTKPLAEIKAAHEAVKVTEEKQRTAPEPKAVKQSAPPESQPIPRPKPARKKNEIWVKLEKQFIENWTGILGSAILVIGVGFLGIYAALKLQAIFRFLMLVGLSSGLFVAYYYLNKKEKWIQFGLWLRSSSAAIFLFACLGSGGIPGLQWIDSPLLALGLLLIGIAANLALSWIGNHQGFASLHGALSLLAMTLAPQNEITLGIAVVITAFGIFQTYRIRWDYHLLLTITLFFVFHLYWFYSLDPDGPQSTYKIVGIVSVALTSISAALVHYRSDYATPKFEVLPFSVHMLNWMFLAVGLMMHSTGSVWKTIPLALGAVAAFFLAKRAKKLGIKWLYNTDTVISLLVGMFATISLDKWGLDALTIDVIVFAELLGFLWLMYKEREQKLYLAGAYAAGAALLVGLLISFGNAMDSESSSFIKETLLLLLLTLGGLAFHWYSTTREKSNFMLVDHIPFLSAKGEKVSIIGILIGPLTLALYYAVSENNGSILLFSILVLGVLYARDQIQSIGMLITSGFVLLALHIACWDQLFNASEEISVIEQTLIGLPVVLVSLASLIWSAVTVLGKRVAWPGVYLTVLQLFVLLHVITEPVSPIIFGVAALMGGLMMLEISQLISNKFHNIKKRFGEVDRYLAHLAYIAFAVFLARHVLIHLQLEEFWGPVKLRVLIELLALVVFSYIVFMPKPQVAFRSWRRLWPLMNELTLIFFAFTISLEVDAFWHAMIWVATSMGLHLLGKQRAELNRFGLYGVIFYLVAVFQVGFLTSSYVTPSTHWSDQAWLSGLMGIAMLFAYLTVFYKFFELKTISFPWETKLLSKLANTIELHRNKILLYPLIICVALFFYWSYDKSLLTFLWVVECLVVFGISILIKEQQFRYAALTGVVICIIRLVFYDLSQEGNLTKALVFVGVGVVMLAMNMLYNKYKSRFEND